ncbi:phosphonate C-P lyase system protein PhnH [Microbacterium sp.]|uniref:phosphonate C-P lyase system protein PhnH n=1 Tax=Microbacterium sp. TaxID=51671 RepID=UPI00273741C1|nr:phosphonate C-P lyase system protein PhnH [Microbacterium sp.]MDP3950280.1 phosphonate C-P lyase system protein PhnH [Microbacterium sp.]
MTTFTTRSHTPGLPHPVQDAQRVFRAVLDALARPTAPQFVNAAVEPPTPLGATVGAVILTLCDEQTPIWLDAGLRAAPEVGAWIVFHTGARIVDVPAEALFVIASSSETAPALSELTRGTDEEPHRSATLIIDARGCAGIDDLTATGPGIREAAEWDGAGLPAGFLPQWQANRALYPCGVDLLLAEETTVRGLPRTTVLTGTQQHHLDRRSA